MFKQRSITKILLLYLFAIFLVTLNLTNVKIAGINDVLPLFDVMMIFYFAVFRRDFGLTFVFFLGIWSDALNGNPLGLTSLSYIIIVKIFMVVNDRFLSKENFLQIWQQFIAFAFVFLLIKVIIFVLIYGKFSSISSVVVQFIISAFAYVFMHLCFDYLSVKLLGK